MCVHQFTPGNLHSPFKEIADILVSFGDQVEGFPDDLLFCVFTLQGGNEVKESVRVEMVHKVPFVHLILSSEPFLLFIVSTLG